MSGGIVCRSGAWQISGECMPLGVRTRSVRAVQLTLELAAFVSSTGDADGESFGLAWAEKNVLVLTRAVARSLGYDPKRVKIEFVPRTGNLVGKNRRLQATSSEFEMRVTVLVGEDATNETASEMLHQLTSGADSTPDGSGGGLATSLAAELKAEGLPVPQGLGVSAAGPPSVVPSFVAAAAKWLVHSWNPCSATCGTGTTSRSVECSGGLADLCEPAERPEMIGECDAYDACDFTINCPLGPGSMDCGVQAFIVWSVVFLLFACMVFIVFLRLRRPAPTRGSITLKGKDATVKSDFRVYRPQSELSKRPSIASHLTSLGSVGSMRSMDEEQSERGAALTQDGKTHIVWEVQDNGMLEKWFAEHGTPFAMQESLKNRTASGGLPRISAAASKSLDNLDSFQIGRRSPSRSSDGLDSFQVGRRSAFGHASPKKDLIQLDDMVDEVDIEVAIDTVLASEHPWLPSGSICMDAEEPGHDMPDVSTSALFADGANVEYFSTTLGQWLLAVVTVRESITGKAQRGVRYDVEICCSGQKRHKVDVELLRAPLQPGEVVEVLLPKSGIWVPCILASGTASVGYVVHAMDGAELPEKVPAVRLRRHFHDDQVVWVHRGGASGWVRGKIVEQADGGEEESPQRRRVRTRTGHGSELSFEVGSPGLPSRGSVTCGSIVSSVPTMANLAASPASGPANSPSCSPSGPPRSWQWLQFKVRMERLGRPEEGTDPFESDYEVVPAYMIRSMGRGL